jgi:acid phosphatase family membrane protein YuiD
MVRQLAYRHIYLVPIICVFFVQCLKFLLYSIVERKVQIGKLIQFDGMPNLHSAAFSSLSTAICIKYGISSILFSLVTTYSVIIVHDTMRLKAEKGKQVYVLNALLSNVSEYRHLHDDAKLRVLSFKPLDVMCGVVLGILGAYILM